MIHTCFFDIQTQGNQDVLDITANVADSLKKSGIKEGFAHVFVSGSTAGLTTIEFEPGVVADLKACFERLVPENIAYRHEEAWQDGNGHSHVRSALQKTSLTVPFMNRSLLLGTWQQIVLIDFDNRARDRRLVMQFIGE